MSTAEIRLTNSYWEMLRFLSNNMKLRLATLLTDSVIESNEATHTDTTKITEMMIAKYAGAWEDERPTEEVIAGIQEMRSSKPVKEFTL